MDPSVLTIWQQALSLPVPNPFIPTDFTLRKPQEVEETVVAEVVDGNVVTSTTTTTTSTSTNVTTKDLDYPQLIEQKVDCMKVLECMIECEIPTTTNTTISTTDIQVNMEDQIDNNTNTTEVSPVPVPEVVSEVAKVVEDKENEGEKGDGGGGENDSEEEEDHDEPTTSTTTTVVPTITGEHILTWHLQDKVDISRYLSIYILDYLIYMYIYNVYECVL